MIEGKSIRSPMSAVIIIRELKNPKWMVGTKELKTRTPNPIQRINEEAIIGFPFARIVAWIASRALSFFDERLRTYSVRK